MFLRSWPTLNPIHYSHNRRLSLILAAAPNQDVPTLEPSFSIRVIFHSPTAGSQCLPVFSPGPSDCAKQRICEGERREGIYSQRCA
jgi:hypothetical protein